MSSLKMLWRARTHLRGPVQWLQLDEVRPCRQLQLPVATHHSIKIATLLTLRLNSTRCMNYLQNLPPVEMQRGGKLPTANKHAFKRNFYRRQPLEKPWSICAFLFYAHDIFFPWEMTMRMKKKKVELLMCNELLSYITDYTHASGGWNPPVSVCVWASECVCISLKRRLHGTPSDRCRISRRDFIWLWMKRFWN